MSETKYIIGIDLGTTNCTMAFAKNTPFNSSGEQPEIVQFCIPQIVAAGLQDSRSFFPSFVYFPSSEELASKTTSIDWAPEREYTLGVYAKQRGSELAGRMISSAKSWLCHDGIDRRERILPLDGSNDAGKMSPVEAASEFLKHLMEAWDQKNPDDSFINQTVLITVPASFDPSARQLVQEAADRAGYPEVVLLEEPQAAFYAWLYKNAESWRKRLKVDDKVLVIDIGGGTTDFTLITVENEQGDLTLKRLAVGSHLLLGGDNMDVALGYMIKQKLEAQGHVLEDNRFNALVYACRSAKETLLSQNPPETYTVAVQGKGSKLIGNSISIPITREEVMHFIVDGFFPLVDPQERSPIERRTGIQQIGLPYTKDPRITAQMAKFLSMTGETDSDSMETFVIPTKILFNGGVLKSYAIGDRLQQQLNAWAEKLSAPHPDLLTELDFDHAVSLGAVYYGLSRRGCGIRIKGGTSRSYYVAVEGSAHAIPGIVPSVKALCVAPFGMEEGSEADISQHEFSLILGEPATFRFFCHTAPQLAGGKVSCAGDFIINWQSELKELHPIESLMDKRPEDGKTIRVRLKSKVTELGVLELWCVAADGRKWKLEFDVRKTD